MRRSPMDHFWLTECPVRNGVLLYHKSSGGDQDACKECGVTPAEWLAADIAMREAGLAQEPDSDDDIRDILNMHEEKASIGRWIGAWPDSYRDVAPGEPWGRGRSWRGDGTLSPRDEAYLGLVLATERTRGYR